MTEDDAHASEITELVLTQHVQGAVADAWTAWTTPEGLARWWWPHWPDTVYVMEARPGGRWSARSQEAATGVEGEVVRLDVPHTLELTWRWDGDDAEDHVRVDLAPQDAGTSVTVRHRTATRSGEDYRQGWEFVLGNLRDLPPA
jgi:uncharacterized protein YndB with AHSA1/START domain